MELITHLHLVPIYISTPHIYVHGAVTSSAKDMSSWHGTYLITRTTLRLPLPRNMRYKYNDRNYQNK
jgi:hypothetical protein